MADENLLRELGIDVNPSNRESIRTRTNKNVLEDVIDRAYHSISLGVASTIVGSSVIGIAFAQLGKSIRYPDAFDFGASGVIFLGIGAVTLYTGLREISQGRKKLADISKRLVDKYVGD